MNLVCFTAKSSLESDHVLGLRVSFIVLLVYVYTGYPTSRHGLFLISPVFNRGFYFITRKKFHLSGTEVVKTRVSGLALIFEARNLTKKVQ